MKKKSANIIREKIEGKERNYGAELELDKIREQQNKPYQNIVFSGGGAKGAIMMGAIEPLETQGIIQEINGISGSSAGSIVGGLVATGAKAEGFKKLSEIPFKSLLGKEDKESPLSLSGNPIIQLLGEEYERSLLTFTGKLPQVRSDGKPLYELLRSEIRSNILDQFYENRRKGTKLKYENDSTELYYKLINMELAEKLEYPNNLTDQQKRKTIESQKLAEKNLEGFYKNTLKLSDQELQKRMSNSKTVTYRDLKDLRKYDPKTFKDLNVTATRISDNTLVVFNAENHPDTEIALSIRASSSFPILFEDVEIDGVRYFDGGFVDNIPQGIFKEDDKTLVLAFIDDKDLKNFEAIHRGDTDLKIMEIEKTLTKSLIEDTAKMALVAAHHKDPSEPSTVLDKIPFIKDIDSTVKILKKGNELKNTHNESNKKTLNELSQNPLNVILLDSKDVSTLDLDKATEKSGYLYKKGSLITQRHLENHDIIEADPFLSLKEYIMAVYEKNISIVDDLDQKIKEINASGINSDEKLKEVKKERDNALQNEGLVKFHNVNLLEFCESNAFQDGEWRSTLDEFMHRLKNPIMIKNAVDILNAPTTPDSVKGAFMFQLVGMSSRKTFTEKDITEHQSIIRNKPSKTNNQKQSFTERLKNEAKSEHFH